MNQPQIFKRFGQLYIDDEELISEKPKSATTLYLSDAFKERLMLFARKHDISQGKSIELLCHIGFKLLGEK